VLKLINGLLIYSSALRALNGSHIYTSMAAKFQNRFGAVNKVEALPIELLRHPAALLVHSFSC
jgi:hypothetical protein